MTTPGTFRAAVEAKDLAAIGAALHPRIAFHSPVMVRPYLGRDAVFPLLGVLLEVFEDFHYTDELVSAASTALIFDARVAGRDVQGLDLLTFGDTGLVTDLTVMVRPLPAAMTLARVVGRRLEAKGPEISLAPHRRTAPPPGVEDQDGR
ncbi:hypothetical protein BZB76_4963 [Actinomadura pelletieri DSM 43383]|uniref:SnoaL-like protein n=1 Tax=Actinomadura pelletieri DSM 43383 TaxID=1120940 RepID=A0A495QJD3_9ACTN|nr:nuclear transport factor 2 family protein [Actinomadura pelletieri]RKS72146.1 hypothetical protein BZB76_4963 [Actinomadura pelletieri DSM 43383]